MGRASCAQRRMEAKRRPEPPNSQRQCPTIHSPAASPPRRFCSLNQSDQLLLQHEMAEAHAHGDDADLELALRLHRELNAVPRRQRAPPRAQAASAALKTLAKKHQQQESESSSSESETEPGSGDKRRRGGAPSGERTAAACALLGCDRQQDKAEAAPL